MMEQMDLVAKLGKFAERHRTVGMKAKDMHLDERGSSKKMQASLPCTFHSADPRGGQGIQRPTGAEEEEDEGVSMSGTEEPVEKRPAPPPTRPGGLGGLHGVDFRKLGYHNPRLEPDVIHSGEEDPKADLHHGYPEEPHHGKGGFIGGAGAERGLTKRLPSIEMPKPVEDIDGEPFDPIVQGFVNRHPGVMSAKPAVPRDIEPDSARGRRAPRAHRIEQSIEHSPTMRSQLVDLPDEVLKEDPTEVREDSMDYQIAAPMDDVDPYADNRQFKISI